ncbi:MAG: hypothetical protein QNK04_00545 [Myxococcota bacterium]|nr:hypothetical protein [Myxococcota bacterium]
MSPAPQCLAGRRVDLEWSSGFVTHDLVERAEAECAAEYGDPGRFEKLCRFRANCRSSEMRRLQALHERELTACRLRKVPIAVHLRGGRETVYFRPDELLVPAREEAQAAMRVCGDARERADLVACMGSLGWEMVGTETRSEWLLD